MEKLNELSLGEKVAGGSGILLLIFSFFTWFKKDVGGFGTYNGHNGWGGFLSLLGILITIVVVAVVLLARFGVITLPDKMGNFTISQVLLAAAGLAFILILLQVLVGQKVGGQSLDRSFWAYLGVLASAGVTAGVFLMFQADTKAGPTA
ncbi:MAG: hypothetical protein JWL73_3612 [Actinomycetia bacterium]|nr:hypothetical protein [Actinomycetes bacterium]